MKFLHEGSMNINLPNVKREKRGNDLVIIVQGYYCQEKKPMKVKPSEIADAYNSILGDQLGFAPVTFATHQSQKIINAINHPSMTDLKGWRDFFNKVKGSSFLMGKNGKNFKASFLWLMDRDVVDKVFLGTYDNREEVSKISITSIKRAVSSGVRSVNELDFLNEKEKQFIVDNGGLIYLGSLTTYNLEKLLSSL
jgi:hypothetical protein